MEDRAARSAPPRTRRSRAVSFVAAVVLGEAILVLVLGGLGLFGQVLVFQAVGPVADPLWPLTGTLEGLGVALALIGIGLVLLAAGVGLLGVHEWAWILAMAVQGASLAAALYGYAHGREPYAALTLASLTVLVLNQREVRQAFVPPDAPA